MRVIKFRVWDSISKKMYGNQYIQITPFRDYQELEHYTLMQYTGLKDKNGKEIYEGDIVRRDDFLPEGEVVFEVVWNEEDANFIFEPFIKGNKEEPLRGYEEIGKMFTELHYCDIIGNIYENQELLK